MHLIMENGKNSLSINVHEYLNKIAAIMRSRFNEFVEFEILDTGKSIAAAQGQVNKQLKTLNFMRALLLDMVVV